MAKGFSLLEVIVAVFIIALSLTTILLLQSRSIRESNYIKNVTTATLLAQAMMAESGLNGPPDTGQSRGNFGPDNPSFNWEKEVTATSFDSLRQMKLRVFWGDGEVSFSTYIFRSQPVETEPKKK